MRTRYRTRNRGFTLVELMIVVAIIGVLAALAVFSVRKYLAAAKAAEAHHTIGAISRAAVAKYERETTVSELVSEGGVGAAASHALCLTAVSPVPAAIPLGRKYQPSTQDGLDWNTGDSTTGWKCLRFGMSEAHYYQYMYTKGTKWAGANDAVHIDPTTTGWQAAARGDVDADGVFSSFAMGGTISATGQPRIFSHDSELNEDE
jgi:type IV pilus assembly protein PilA